MPSEMPQILCILARKHGAASLLTNANRCRGLLNEHGLKHHLLKHNPFPMRIQIRGMMLLQSVFSFMSPIPTALPWAMEFEEEVPRPGEKVKGFRTCRGQSY